MLLSLCNHSPPKISGCRFPGWLQFHTWILIQSLHLPPSPCQSSQRCAARPLVKLSVCVADKMLWGSGERPWNHHRAGETGPQPYRAFLTVAIMAKRLPRARGNARESKRWDLDDLRTQTCLPTNRSFRRSAHGSPPWLNFEPPPPLLHLSFRSPAGERAENRMGGRGQGSVCGGVCLCVSMCVGAFRKGKALGHQRDFEAILRRIWSFCERGFRGAVPQRHLAGRGSLGPRDPPVGSGGGAADAPANPAVT